MKGATSVKIIINKTKTIMAEVVEKQMATNSKANAALTTGIIGTSLAGLLVLGRHGIGRMFGWGSEEGAIARGELYNERKEQADYVELTKQFYEGQIAGEKELNDKFFSLYKMNTDNSFALYKNHVDDSFRLYKGQRDSKDELIAKINEAEYIKQELYKKFGEPYTNLWLRHVCCNETYEKLIQETGNTNLKYICRKILKYVREELTKRDLKTKQMIEDLRIRD